MNIVPRGFSFGPLSTGGCQRRQISFFVAALLAGSAGVAAEENHEISAIVMSPTSPAEMLVGEMVNVVFNYATSQSEGVYAWAQPLSNGELPTGFAYEASPLLMEPEGAVEREFTVNAPATVDEVRVFMMDADREEVLAEVFVPVNYVFSEPDPGTKRWAFQTDLFVASSAAIGYDETIYVGSQDGHLYALSPEGKEQWSLELSWQVETPAIGKDGTIYIGSWDNYLHAVSPDGKEQWAFETGGVVNPVPAIGHDGTIYVGSTDGKLYAVTPDGQEKWSFQTAVRGDSEIWSAPAVGKDGVIYVGSSVNRLYAIMPDGEEKWSFSAGDNISSSPAIGDDGIVYVGSMDGFLYAVNPEGDEEWAFETGGGITSSPAIGKDGTIYVGSHDGHLYAVTPDNVEKWAFETPGSIDSSPAVAADGTVYVGSHVTGVGDEGYLFAVSPDGQEKWAFPTNGQVWSSPTIDRDGTVYIGSSDGNLYAVEGESPLADSPWPSHGRDLQNNRRVPMDLKFLDWIESRYSQIDIDPPEDLEPDSDPGGFGIPMLLRYAFDMHPVQPELADLPEPKIQVPEEHEEKFLTVTYTRHGSAMDLDYQVEVSDDLLEWEPLGEDLIVAAEDVGNDAERVTVRDKEAVDGFRERFIRVVVEKEN